MSGQQVPSGSEVTVSPTDAQQRDQAPVAGVTAREIAHGTGLSLSSVYRILRDLQAKGLIIKHQIERQPGSAKRSGANG